VRSCTDDIPREHRERPCLDFHIGRCKAPCVGWQDEASYRAMIEEVLGFLEGRTVDVRARVRDLMAAASDRQDFERARELRDTLRWLDRVEAPTSVEVIGTGDADVLGYARDGDDAVGVLFRVRDGRVVHREHRFLENVEEVSDPRCWAPPGALACRRPTGPARDPAVRGGDMAGAEALAPVSRDSPAGHGRAVAELADQSARHLLESLRIDPRNRGRAEDPVYALGRDLGLGIVPRVSSASISRPTRARHRRLARVVQAGRPGNQSGFKIQGIGQQDDYAAIHEVMTRPFAAARRASRSRISSSSMVGKGRPARRAEACAS
jgi:excinuclease ABC subunit C